MLLLVASVTFGSIVTDTDYSYDDSGGTGTTSPGSQSSGVWAIVNGNAPSGWAGCEGEYILETTENAWCNWSCYVYVYATVTADEVDGYVNANASASADTYTPHGYAEVPNASVQVTETDTETDGPFSDSESGTNYFSGLNRRCRANHETVVSAVVAPGSASTASAHGCVNASITMTLD
jgi:hypothetical protein